MSELRALIAQLREADRDFKVFGSATHRYELRPRLSPHEVRAFENEHGVTLPEDYRAFLLEVGNGGAGPYYGVASLDRASRNSALSEPFPYEERTESLPEEDETLEYVRDYFPGILEICHFGSGIFFYLVVTGPAQGTVWMGREDFYPEATSFLEWYRAWAQQKLTLLQNEPLVGTLRLGMTTDEVNQVTGTAWTLRETPRVRFYESSVVPAQLELDPYGVVIAVNPSRFL